MEVGLGRLSIDRRAGRRSWLSDGAGKELEMHKMMKKCRFLGEKVGFYEKCCNFDATK